jgi:Helix-turn-helix domain
VTQDDLLYRFRLRVFAMAQELGNVRAACRAMGIHPSTYYRWKRQLDRHRPEILRPRERRPPPMANATSVLVEQRVVALALGHPGFGPARIAVELAQPRWVASSCRPTGSGGGCAATACPPGPSVRPGGRLCRATDPERPPPPPEQHLQVDHPGGLSSWTVSASAGCRAPTAPCGRTPPSTSLRPLPGRASRSLGATLSPMDQRPGPPGRRRSGQPRLATGAGHERQRPRVPPRHLPGRHCHPGRPAQLHPGRSPADQWGVERVQETILDGCWKPAFAAT